MGDVKIKMEIADLTERQAALIGNLVAILRGDFTSDDCEALRRLLAMAEQKLADDVAASGAYAKLIEAAFDNDVQPLFVGDLSSGVCG